MILAAVGFTSAQWKVVGSTIFFHPIKIIRKYTGLHFSLPTITGNSAKKLFILL